jgi:hypothetical protein
MKVDIMSRMKPKFFAIAAVLGVVLSASPANAACIAVAENNFCHADFNIDDFTSSSFKSATITTNVRAQTSGTSAVKTAAATAAVNAAATAGFNATTGANSNAPGSYSVGGMNYNIDGSGYGAISVKALKNVTTEITWTTTQAGPFSFKWLVSGESSAGASAFVIINGSQTLLTNTASALSPKSGTSIFNVGLGQAISFRMVGTTNNALLNSSQLEVSAFKGVPEIDGGVLPLGLLLLGVMFIAAKRRDAGEDEAGLVA